MKAIIKNGLLKGCSDEYITDEPLDIYIEGKTIKDIGKSLEYDAEIIDATGKIVMPGLIDMYCTAYELGYENEDNIVILSEAAAAGGYTSVTMLPDVNPNIDNKTVVEYIASKSKKYSRVNIFPYGSTTKQSSGFDISEIGEMVTAGVVALSDAGKSVSDSNVFRNILLYSSMFDVPVITFCQDEHLAQDGVINKGYMSTKTGLNGIPSEAEELMVARNLIIAGSLGTNVHITHVSTKGSVDLIRYYKNRGIKVTCDTCPHYFSLSERAVDDYNTFAKVSPPLRTDDDINAIADGLKDKTIDVISTGHTPVSIDNKIIEFDKASFGISSLETAFAVSYTSLVASKKMTLDELVKAMSARPAEILKLKNKGQIKPGFDADLAIVDVDNPFKVSGSKFLSKAKYTPYENLELKGRVVKTLVGGNIIYESPEV